MANKKAPVQMHPDADRGRAPLAEAVLELLTPREQAYRAIDSEREYQQAVWPDGAGCARSIGEEILCMEDCLLETRKAWQKGSDSDPADVKVMLDHVRKVATVAVRCLSNHGAPLRVMPAELKLAKLKELLAMAPTAFTSNEAIAQILG